MKFYNLPSLLLVVITLSGCGQMGPLYIPIEVPPVPVAPKKVVQPQEVEIQPAPTADTVPEKKQTPAKAKTTSKSNTSSKLKK